MGHGVNDTLASWIYFGALLWPLLCLTYYHVKGRVNLLSAITTTKEGVEYVDGKKLAYVGAFAAATIAFAYLAVTDRFSEWYVTAYLTAFIAGKFLGDREQRLHAQAQQPTKTP